MNFDRLNDNDRLTISSFDTCVYYGCFGLAKLRLNADIRRNGDIAFCCSWFDTHHPLLKQTVNIHSTLVVRSRVGNNLYSVSSTRENMTLSPSHVHDPGSILMSAGLCMYVYLPVCLSVTMWIMTAIVNGMSLSSMIKYTAVGPLSALLASLVIMEMGLE